MSLPCDALLPIDFLKYILKFFSEIAVLTTMKGDDDASKPVTYAGQQRSGKIPLRYGRKRVLCYDCDPPMLAIPMLAILIVFAHLRVKVDLEGTNPPDCPHKAFYGAVSVIYIQVFIETMFMCFTSKICDLV